MSNLNPLVEALRDEPGLIIVVLTLVLGFGIAFFSIALGMITSTIRYRSRERTRREIAAYIAEGSMTPEEGERLLKAGKTV
ncbi:MAG: hypothetical protein RIB32_02875 [Phycisphaerales bacterium]